MIRIGVLGDRHVDRRSPRYDLSLAMWRWSLDDMREQGATAVIGAGDVCESTADGAAMYEIGRCYQQALTLGPVGEACGNHESRDGLRVYELLGVTVAWDAFRAMDLGEAHVLLAPYARVGNPPYEDLNAESMEAQKHDAAVRLGMAIQQSRAFAGDRPLLVIGHWSVAGMIFGADNTMEVHSGREMVVPLDLLAPATLVLTGHVHKAQDIAPNVVGVGAMYRTNFGEAAYTPSYTLVTVDAGRVTYERRPIPCRAMFVDTLDWPLTDATRASLTDARALDWLRGQEVKLTVRISEDQLGTFDPSAFDAVRDVASYFVLERETVSAQRTRVSAIAAADTVDAQLLAWLKSFSAAPEEEDAAHWARLTAKLAEVTTP